MLLNSNYMNYFKFALHIAAAVRPLKAGLPCLYCRTLWWLRGKNRIFTPQIHGTLGDNLYSTDHFNFSNISILLCSCPELFAFLTLYFSNLHKRLTNSYQHLTETKEDQAGQPGPDNLITILSSSLPPCLQLVGYWGTAQNG